MTFLAGFIVTVVKASSILIGCVRPAQPIGDNASPGEVESGKSGDPPGSLLY
jgi:hypothetical protein